MHHFLNYFSNIPPVGCFLLIIVLLFMIPQKKRTGVFWEFPLCAAGALLLSVWREEYHAAMRHLAHALHESGEAGKVIPVILAGEGVHLLAGVLILILFYYICTFVSIPNAVILALCSYLTMDLYVSCLSFLPAGEGAMILITAFTLVFCGIIYYLFAVRIIRNRPHGRKDAVYIILMAGILLMNHILFTYHAEEYGRQALVEILLCISFTAFLSLLVQVLREEKEKWQETAELEILIRQQKQKEYDSLRPAVEDMQQHLHNLKYVMAARRQNPDCLRDSSQADTLEENIAVIENHMDTGNEVLDVLLSDAWQRCRQMDVRWTCMADGAALRFIDPADLYIIVGNALDNALESLSAAGDPEKRFLSVNIWSRKRMAFLRMENYCETLPSFREGLPLTTKKEGIKHGHGMKSIKQYVEKYGGEMSASVEDQVFVLKMLIPLPEQESGALKQD